MGKIMAWAEAVDAQEKLEAAQISAEQCSQSMGDADQGVKEVSMIELPDGPADEESVSVAVVGEPLDDDEIDCLDEIEEESDEEDRVAVLEQRIRALEEELQGLPASNHKEQPKNSCQEKLLDEIAQLAPELRHHGYGIYSFDINYPEMLSLVSLFDLAFKQGNLDIFTVLTQILRIASKKPECTDSYSSENLNTLIEHIRSAAELN